VASGLASIRYLHFRKSAVVPGAVVAGHPTVFHDERRTMLDDMPAVAREEMPAVTRARCAY
jgi:hypothetical protein